MHLYFSSLIYPQWYKERLHSAETHKSLFSFCQYLICHISQVLPPNCFHENTRWCGYSQKHGFISLCLYHSTKWINIMFILWFCYIKAAHHSPMSHLDVMSLWKCSTYMLQVYVSLTSDVIDHVSDVLLPAATNEVLLRSAVLEKQHRNMTHVEVLVSRLQKVSPV